MILFGVGILQFIRRFERFRGIGSIGASLYIAMGVVSVLTATVFPQDARDSLPTFIGEMHKILSGVVGMLSLLAMCFLGIWFRRAALFPGFAVYSFITIGLVIISTAFYVVSMDSPFMGLTERITIFFGFLWTFILARWMFFRSG